MPLFPGERPITQEQLVAEHPDAATFEVALPVLLAQTHLRRPQVALSIVPTAVYNFIVVRTWRATLGPTQEFRPNPETWWVFDPDLDEESSEAWVAQATFNARGYIDYGPDGEVPVRRTRSASFTDPDPPGAAFENLLGDDEGDTIGATPPRPSIPRQVHEELQRQRRLPQGNSSVRNAVEQMRTLNARDATYEDDNSLDDVLLGNHFMERTASPTFQTQPARPEPDPTMADVVGTDITGRPLIARRDAPKTVYDHLNDNLQDIRAARPAPSVWDRLAAQRKSK